MVAKQAADHDNSDATDRLTALDTPAPQTISRRDHLTHVDTKLQHTRTLAKNRSQKAGRKAATDDSSSAAAPSGSQTPAQPNDLSRKKTMRLVQETAGDGGGPGPGRRRRNRTQGASEAPPPMPSLSGGLWNASQPGSGPSPGPAPGGRISSQPQPPSGFVGGFQGTPERSSFAGPPGSGFAGGAGVGSGAGPIPRPSSAANSSGMGSFQSAPSNYGGGGGSPYNPGGRPPANGMPGPPPSASTGAGGAGAGAGGGSPTKRPSASGPDPVVYQTFAEMGFQSKKTQNDKDCVIC